jgi:hypothetical protein
MRTSEIMEAAIRPPATPHAAEDVEDVLEAVRAPRVEQARDEVLVVHERDERGPEPPEARVEALALVVGEPASGEQDAERRECGEPARVDQREAAQ